MTEVDGASLEPSLLYKALAATLRTFDYEVEDDDFDTLNAMLEVLEERLDQ